MSDGTVVTGIKQIHNNDTVSVTVTDGVFYASVKKVEEHINE